MYMCIHIHIQYIYIYMYIYIYTYTYTHPHPPTHTHTHTLASAELSETLEEELMDVISVLKESAHCSQPPPFPLLKKKKCVNNGEPREILLKTHFSVRTRIHLRTSRAAVRHWQRPRRLYQGSIKTLSRLY
jgi:hypothetical protein